MIECEKRESEKNKEALANFLIGLGIAIIALITALLW